MDPTVCYRTARDNAARILAMADAGEERVPDDAIEMAEAFQALDVWLSCGGFLPTEWQDNRPVA
jgi:hypothetical protein